MKFLILDFLRRWRWLFLIALLLSLGSSFAGAPLVFAPAAVVALLLDAQRGIFRAVRPLPVTRRDQARAWWFVGVPLLPLLSLPVLVIGVLLLQEFNPNGNSAIFKPVPRPPMEAPQPVSEHEEPAPPTHASEAPANAHRFSTAPKQTKGTPAPWFAAGVQVWVMLGYTGFCFFLMQWAPTRPAENVTEHVQQGVFGGLWGLSMPGVAFLLPNLPRTPDAIAPWHWALFVAAPIFVAVSYFGAADLVQRRMVIVAAKTRPQDASEAGAVSRGWTGIPLYVANFGGRIVVFVGLIACVQIAVLSWMSQGNAPRNNPAIGMQLSLMGMMLGAVIAESVGMRAFRALPLSTPKLALLLAILPWAGAFTSAVFSAVWCRSGDPSLSVWMNLAAQSLALCGWVTLAFAITLHIASGVRLFVLMLLVMIPGVAIPFAVNYAMLFAGIGSVAGIAGFALLVRGLRKSSAFYRPRGFFGMTPGQPSAVR